MQVSQLLSVVSALSFVALVSGQHAVPDVSTYSDQHCQDNKANISPRTQECTSATGSSLYIGNIKYACDAYQDENCQTPVTDFGTTGADTCFHGPYGGANTAFKSVVCYMNGPY